MERTWKTHRNVGYSDSDPPQGTEDFFLKNSSLSQHLLWLLHVPCWQSTSVPVCSSLWATENPEGAAFNRRFDAEHA